MNRIVRRAFKIVHEDGVSKVPYVDISINEWIIGWGLWGERGRTKEHAASRHVYTHIDDQHK